VERVASVRQRLRAVCPARVLQAALLGLALVVGTAMRWHAVPSKFGPHECQQADVYRYYVSTAESFLAGRGWATDYEWNFIPPPLQAAFIVVTRLVLPEASYGTMRYVQAVLSVATILLAGWVGLELGGRWAGVAAASLVALDRNVVEYVAILLAENNHFFLLFAFLGLLLLALRRESAWLMAAAGAALALASLAKPFPMFLSAVVPLWTIFRRPGRASVLRAGLFAAAFVLTVAPWLVRNHERYGRLYPISTNSGTLLAQSNFVGLDPWRPEMIFWDSIYRTDLWKDPAIERRFAGRVDRYGQGEWNERDRAYLGHFVHYVLDHPLHFLRNYVVKLYNVFRHPLPRSGEPWYPSHHYRVITGLLGLLGLAWFAVAERSRPRAVLLVIFAYYAGFSALMHIDAAGRINLPLKLLLSLFAAYLLGRLAERLVPAGQRVPAGRRELGRAAAAPGLDAPSRRARPAP
jgi:hypothetical protein